MTGGLYTQVSFSSFPTRYAQIDDFDLTMNFSLARLCIALSICVRIPYFSAICLKSLV